MKVDHPSERTFRELIGGGKVKLWMRPGYPPTIACRVMALIEEAPGVTAIMAFDGRRTTSIPLSDIRAVEFDT